MRGYRIGVGIMLLQQNKHTLLFLGTDSCPGYSPGWWPDSSGRKSTVWGEGFWSCECGLLGGGPSFCWWGCPSGTHRLKAPGRLNTRRKHSSSAYFHSWAMFYFFPWNPIFFSSMSWDGQPRGETHVSLRSLSSFEAIVSLGNPAPYQLLSGLYVVLL